ncbi:hypothetical protein PLIIFM63780_002130 [Purpureocillium lilacinum]|uniref:uncharacterized protein n=1 Tax=Purpureocillium lilacinum TaxID=33203 RepID=UPI00207F0636|nr:hypothetical protein PLICBS_010106 [Purpureocillium lilacinum]GJN78621.1 hypothetical protein PLIIFM63780_002130 [Purpureocillium lilacinum]
MSDPGGGDVFGAFNALLGYLGGQAATTAIFDRFLWPQRHFSSLNLESTPRLVLLYSMAGPLSPAALGVMDTVYRYGLLGGTAQGHMLGTAFYRDLGMSYTMHARGAELERVSQVRNCIWVQALLKMPIPDLQRPRQDKAAEEGRPLEQAGGTGKQPVRARVTVDHLVLAKATAADIANRGFPVVREGMNSIGLETVLAMCLAEFSGIGVMIGVTVILRSLWAILFVMPLVMRILGALLAMHREGLDDLSEAPDDEAHRDWEVQCPATEGKFILISGPPSVVNQFFRHYGHPIRSQAREKAQLVLIVAFGILFPASLLCQVLWMPRTIQLVWTVWQIWLVIAMHLDRYSQKGMWRSTADASIGRAFSQARTVDVDNNCAETSILFCQRLNKPGAVKATLNTTLASSYGEGKKCMKSLVQRSSEIP